jgi:hypothetical protein
MNANGIADASDDVNGDGNVDSWDCEGLTGPKGDTGVAGHDGADGATGPMGKTGTPGAPGLLDVSRVSASSATDATSSKQVSATCSEGQVLLGGGYDVNGPASEHWIVSVQKSYPSSASTWHVQADALYARIADTADCNCSDDDWSITAWAICADLP